MNQTFMLHNVIYIVLTVISHILAGLFLEKQRFSKRITAIIWCVFTMVFTFSMAFNANSTYFISLVLHFVLFYITTLGNAQEKCFLFLLYVCIYTCFSTLFVCLNYVVHSTVALVVIALTIMLVMQTVLYKVLLPAFRQVTPYVKNNWAVYYFIVIVFFALIVVQSLFPALSPFTVKETVVFIITVIAFFIICIAIFHSMSNMVQLESEKRKQIQTEFLLAQVDAQAKEVENARRNRHDMRHHNSILLEYARSGDLDSIISYLEKQFKHIDTTTPVRFCDNDTVNNILHIYQTKAEKSGVRIKIRAAVPKRLDIDYPDLVAIVSNALENALHGALASGTEKPWITVKFYSKDEHLVFNSKNSCNDALQFDEMRDNMQGIGIKSIITSAERYNGNCRFAAQNGVFECLVIMDITSDK